ncbi:NlpC/P60 family protein [Streptomyces sp. HUAS TT7]|uniref:C40 family peptidase n=1 Tax=Streptomyces sp. HUAS TT7 TaxID=3447507 RepID=UPI003F65792C
MKAGFLAAAAAAAAVPLAAIGLILAAAGAGASGPSLGGAGGAGLKLAAMPESGRMYASWYTKSARQCPQLTPALLAAQDYHESNFDPTIVSPAGAVGIAQFLPGTFQTWGEDSDGNGIARPTDPGDAIMAQGKFMCDLIARAEKSGYSGTPIELALAGYNAGWGNVIKFHGVPPASWAGSETYTYVHEIIETAQKWSAAAGISGLGTGSGPDAVRRAATQLGLPYSWGGGSPEGPGRGFCDGTNGYSGGSCSASVTVGWDCSSLTQYAWWPSLKLPRTAADQYAATASRPVTRDALQPGDLLFWSKGGPGAIYHVALYAGNGQILSAPRTGKNVELADMDKAMPSSEYVGATRPGS